MRRVLAVTVLAVLLCAAPAGARSVIVHPYVAPSADALLAYYLPIARAPWPGSPCAGREQIELVAPEPGVESIGGSAEPDTCTAQVDPKLTSSEFCAVLTHELGHLAGYGHSPDPDNVMYPTPKPPPYCVPVQGPTVLQAELGDLFHSRWIARCRVVRHRWTRCSVSTPSRKRLVDIKTRVSGAVSATVVR